jgi:hypothetical protein
MIEHIERFLRLKEQIRQLAGSRQKLRALHLSASGTPTDPDVATREKAFLIQVRLDLEAQVDGSTHEPLLPEE